MENKRLRFKRLKRLRSLRSLRSLTSLIGLIGGLILVSFLLSLTLHNANDANEALAYDDQTTHQDLTREIITFYELSTGKKLTEEQKQWVIQGSIDEDAAPRWFNHFYDPVYNRGLDSIWGTGYPAKFWAQYSSYQTAAVRFMTSAYYYLNTPMFGDFSYEAGIKRYSSNKETEAYLTLGHILHLIEDMTVPEHTRNDPHPALNDALKSNYKDWTKKNSSKLTENLGKKLSQQGLRPVFYSNLATYFDQVASYSNKYFFGSHTINSKDYQNPKIIWEDNKFGYGIDNNGNYFKLVSKDVLTEEYKLRSDAVMQDYWSRLSRQAVINGAGIIHLFLTEAEAARQSELAKQKINEAASQPKPSLISRMINFFAGQSSQPALTIVSEPSAPQIPQPQRTPEIPIEIVTLNLQSANPIPPKNEPLSNLPLPQTPTPVETQTSTQPQQTPTPPSQPEVTPLPPPTYTYTGGGGGGGGGSSSSNSNTQNQQTQINQTQNDNTTQTDSDSNVQKVLTFKAGDLVINEIMYNPERADDKHEWIEIYNNSGSAITLTGGNNGWRFNDGSNHLFNEPPTNGSQGSLTLSAGGYAILASNAVTFLSDYSGYNGTVIDTVMSLKNSTSTVKIIAPDGTVIDEVIYSNSWGANGNGKTLERKSPSGPSNDQTNWAESSPNGGTPSAANNWLEPATTTIDIATSTLDFATSTPDLATSTPSFTATSTSTSTPQIVQN